MTQESWNRLSLFEQLSNIDGEVKRLVEAHEAFVSGNSQTDHSDFYIEKIDRLIRMTVFDPKNSSKGYRELELMDELNEIKDYLAGKESADYIMRYWNQYTNAIS